MRQRLALARAYAVRPEFLLMDEPFGALDAQTRSDMPNVLLEVSATERKTVMLITHSVEEAIYLASKIVVVTARPARVREMVEVPFVYPRDESSHEQPEFGELRSHIREAVMTEYRARRKQARPSLRPELANREDAMINRRRALGLAAGAAALGLAAPAVTQGSKKVRVGYLHTLAVDGQIWIGVQRESFGKRGSSWSCAS